MTILRGEGRAKLCEGVAESRTEPCCAVAENPLLRRQEARGATNARMGRAMAEPGEERGESGPREAKPKGRRKLTRACACVLTHTRAHIAHARGATPTSSARGPLEFFS
jgi:hypothetical protein